MRDVYKSSRRIQSCCWDYGSVRYRYRDQVLYRSYVYIASEARAGRYFSFTKIGRYEAKSLARFACCSNKEALLVDIEEADMIFKDIDASKRLLYLVKDDIVTKTKY